VSRVKKLLIAAGIGLLALLAVVVIRSATLPSLQVAAVPVHDLAIDVAVAATHLAGAVQFHTVARADGWPEDPAAVLALHRYLVTSFPRVHATLRREVVGGYSLLYTWAGSDPSLPPLLLLSHMDVVPVEAAAAQRWTAPPFSGRVAGGWIWGRGTLDDKVGVVGVLEAAEYLLGRGFQPRRTVYFAFGADEEVGGHRGAASLASLLASRHVTPALILDEGGLITDGVTGTAGPVALIGTAEKGYVSLELRAEGTGGHSSMPPAHTAIGRLAAALTRLEAQPMPARIRGATADSFTVLAPELPFGRRLFLANLWLFEPLALNFLGSAPESNAMVRTTTAETVVSGGVKDNVLPQEATAVVNFRILPGDTIADVERHVQETVADPAIRVRRVGGAASEPSRASDCNRPEFALVARSLREVIPGTLVIPNLLSGATDSRHYAALSPAIYRFVPMRLTRADLRRIHGTDERIGVDNFGEVVRFYAQLLRNSQR
jgi:carboxypeptidase PM20D1